MKTAEAAPLHYSTDIVEVLEDILVKAKKGELRMLAAAYVNTDGTNEHQMVTPVGSQLARLISSVSWMNYRLLKRYDEM